MKSKASFAIAMIVTGLYLSPVMVVAEEATPAELAAQCKQEAVQTGIPADDIIAYVAECLSDYGVENAEIEKITKTMVSPDKSEK